MDLTEVGIPLLSTDDMRAIVSRITYKPGWHIVFVYDNNLGTCVRVEAVVNDVKNPEVKTTLHLIRYVPMGMNEEAFLHFLASMVQEAELHESMEWFMVDGKVFDDPHKGAF